ncbi:MAG: deoxyribodipyrimidine photo-lyase, partial [Verrucomicrobiota bacterium]|nr:deoxyribodipyrimidine photo-lyase [Verrucomicrobiota bacterium]
MNTTKTIMWFRQDLRITDNPALNEACLKGDIIPVFIHDNVNHPNKQIGSASKWWLHQSLISLNNNLDGELITLTGDPKKIIPELLSESGATSVVWNRNYEPWQIERDSTIKSTLEADGFNVSTFNASLLWEPWKILNQSGLPYKV